MIVNLNSIIDKVAAVIRNPETFAYKLDMYNGSYSFQLGRTTYFAGIPSHGKSTFLFENQIQLSEQYGLKHVVFAPEEGTVPEIYATILSMYTKKQNRTGAYHRLTDLDLTTNAAFISSHFHVFDTKEVAPTPTELLEEIKPYILEHKINTLSIDPWNELKHSFGEHGGRQDVYLERVLGDIRLYSRKQNIHTFIVAHPRTLQKQKDTGQYEPPTAFEFSGGATWYAKADGIICVYRPNEFSEAEFERTYVDIIIQKAKRGIGKKDIIKMDYSLLTQRYEMRQGEAQRSANMF
jgi:twinkle protein